MVMQDQDSLAYSALTQAHASTRGYRRADCPFCPMLIGKSDKRRSFSIHTPTGYYSCFRCGTRGRIREMPEHFLVKVEDVGEYKSAFNPPESFDPLVGCTALCVKPAINYLASRGVTKRTTFEAQIGACTQGDYRYRVVVPILGSDQKTWLGYVGRDWTNKATLRYRYPDGMPRGQLLYNHDAIHVETDDPVLVVEGVFDALPYWPDAVACLGKPNDWQFQALLASKRPIVIVLDGDAHEEGWALALRLQFEGKRAASVRLPPKSDPNDVQKAWLLEEARRTVQ